MKEVTSAGNGYHMRGDCAYTLTYSTANAVTAGNPIKATDYTQTGKSATVGYAIKATNYSGAAMTGIAYASTFNSQVLDL